MRMALQIGSWSVPPTQTSKQNVLSLSRPAKDFDMFCIITGQPHTKEDADSLLPLVTPAVSSLVLTTLGTLSFYLIETQESGKLLIIPDKQFLIFTDFPGGAIVQLTVF